MATPAVLCVIFGENDSSKISLPSGIPHSVEELKNEIRRQCEVSENFRLQYKDMDFHEFIIRKSSSDIQNKAIIKVIYLPHAFVASSPCLYSETTGTSISSMDTDILSSSYSLSSSFPNQVKKSRREEVTYCPDHLSGESKESFEEERLAQFSEVRKSNNHQVVKEKMENTFAYRRHEVIDEKPLSAELKKRWPAHFCKYEVEAEFTTVPLRSKFMQQLDHYSTRLMTIFRKKGGAAGCKTTNIMKDLDMTDAVETRRAYVLKAFMLYPSEDPYHLIREYMDYEDNQEAMVQTVLGIFAIKVKGAGPKDNLAGVRIILEGVDVLNDLDNIANALAILFGLIYTLDLSYPTNRKYTFEVLQKRVMELDSSKLSTKAQVLKNKLFEGTL